MNQKLVLIIEDKPPVPPANTGIPINPIIMYNSCETNPFLEPSIAPDIIANNDCKLMGTGPTGILINAPTAVRAANIEQCIKSLIVNLI